MIPSIPRLEDYEISKTSGFLPSEPPLELLPDSYYQPWENIIRNLQSLLLSKRLHKMVDDLPVLSTEYLKTTAEWQRAYSILTFLTHSYIWGGDGPRDVIPQPVSIPLKSVCAYLEVHPVATYASLVLWNSKPIFVDEPADRLENLATLATFTGSLDESWFYLVSAVIEARGGPTIPLMLHAIQAARYKNADMVAECLRSLAERIDELGTLLTRTYENCDPQVFYHRIRPFIAGSKNMAEAGLPNGVLYDTGSSDDKYVQLSGASAAQSSLIQFLDIVLGIEHRPTGTTADSKDAAPPNLQGPSQSFIHEMRHYMPGPHARFLEHVASIANIRTFVSEHRQNRDLALAYDACLAMLRTFRDKHIQIVSRYIVIKSRESRSHSRSLSPRSAPNVTRLNIANRKDSGDREKSTPKGTGGTALIPFLKQSRDETGEPAIQPWTRRLFNQRSNVSRAEEPEEERDDEIVGLAGVWKVGDSDGGLCHY